MRSENIFVNRLAGQVIGKVVLGHKGKVLTPQRAVIIKKEFLTAMKKVGFDWSINATEISIEIMTDGSINLHIPPALLNPVIH